MLYKYIFTHILQFHRIKIYKYFIYVYSCIHNNLHFLSYMNSVCDDFPSNINFSISYMNF